MEGTPHPLPRRLLRAAAAAAALLAIAPQVFPARWFFDVPERAAMRAEASFYRDLLARNGMEALWTFDGPGFRGWHPETKHLMLGGLRREQAAPYRQQASGVSLVPGRFGLACRFPGRDESFVRSGHVWTDMPAGFTLALWVRLEPLPARQDLFSTADCGVWGLRLENGNLLFDVVAETGAETLSCPFAKYGEFVHVAAVSDDAAGRLLLYLDGRLAASKPVAAVRPADWVFAFGANSRFRVRETIRGDVDDAGVWNRPLDAGEIRRIASSRVPLDRLLAAPLSRVRPVLARAWRDAMGALGGLALPRPEFAALRSESRPGRVALVLPKGNARKLLRAHGRARRAGLLSDKDARSVSGHLRAGGRTVPVRISLFGTTCFYPDGARPAYSILPEDPSDVLPGGFRRVVLAPPERSGWSIPLAESLVAEETGLPLAPRAGPVLLRVNGREAGAYLMRDFSLAGAAPASGFRPGTLFGPQRGGHVLASEENLVDPTGLSPAVSDALGAFFGEERLERLLRRLESRVAVFRADSHSPVPARLRAGRLRDVREAVETAGRRHPSADGVPLSEALLAGDDPPFRIVRDLDFAAFATNLAPGLSVRFRSAGPDWISDEGRLLRRPEDEPRHVSVEAELRDGGGGVSVRRLSFRILPENVRVPAVLLWSGSVFDRLRRCDAAVSFVPAGPCGAGPVRTFSASVSAGAGVRWRGNSSFVNRHEKKLLNVETDVPHGVFPGSPTRKLLQIDAHTDRLHVWNTLAFDTFRLAPRADGKRNHAPRVFRSELFLNGEYGGFCEWAERIDADLVGNPRAVFFRHAVGRPRVPGGIQVRPSRSEADFEDRYRALCALFADPAPDDWLERAKRSLDMDGWTDCRLLLDLFQNVNVGGGDFPFMEYAVWDPGPDRWFHVPWDYDASLPSTGLSYTTGLDRRLAEGDPGYTGRLADRWRTWRLGCASDGRLFGEFDRLVGESRGYLRDEIARFDRVPDPDAWIEDAIRTARGRLREQLRILDGRFGFPGGADETPPPPVAAAE